MQQLEIMAHISPLRKNYPLAPAPAQYQSLHYLPSANWKSAVATTLLPRKYNNMLINKKCWVCTDKPVKFAGPGATPPVLQLS